MNSRTIVDFHEDVNKKKNEDEADKTSIGSISCADQKDMELLFSGDHTYQFQAV